MAKAKAKDDGAPQFMSGTGKDAKPVYLYGDVEAITPGNEGMSVLHLAGGSTVAVAGNPDDIHAQLAD